MSTTINEILHDKGWADLVDWLPPDLDEIAERTGALSRRRAVRSGADLLRLAFAYGPLGQSLRQVSTWAAMAGVAELSDVAVLKRLRSAVPFLDEVLRCLLQRRMVEPASAEMGLRVRLIDATTVSAPGSKGTDWRVHVAYDVRRGEIDRIEITDETGGEHLGRLGVQAGDLAIGDRAYAHAERIAEVRRQGGHVLVRVGYQAVPMKTANGEDFDPLNFAQRVRTGPGRPPKIEAQDVLLKGQTAGETSARLIVLRKSKEAAEKERNRILREASRKGKTPRPRTLEAAAYTFLLTTVPRETASDALLAELYRVRWQVEMAFKRLKSLAHLDELRARSPELAKVDLLAKLIAAVLVDLIARQMRAFSPWGFPIRWACQSLEANQGHPRRHPELHPWSLENSRTSQATS